MALIERLMKHPSEPEERWIAVHPFFAAAEEIDFGKITQATVKTAFNMTAEDIVDFDALVALVTGAATSRSAMLQHIHCTFILAQTGFIGYTTPALVRTKLGI